MVTLVYCISGAVLISAALALKIGTLRLVRTAFPILEGPRISHSWVTPLCMIWAFFAKDCVDQPLNAVAHDPAWSKMVPSTAPSAVQTMSWSSWATHLGLFALDGVNLAWVLGFVAVKGIMLPPGFSTWARVLSLLGGLGALAGAAGVHSKLTPDNFLVSLALVLLVAWAVRLGARGEIRRLQLRQVKRSLNNWGLTIVEKTVTASWTSRIFLSLTAAALEAAAWQSDTFFKFLGSSAFMLLFTVIAGFSDPVGGAVRRRSDQVRDAMIRRSLTKY